MATIKKTYTLVNANTPKAMRLQGIGWVKGTEAGSLQVGDSIVWNYGAVSVVVSISETEKMIKVTTNTGMRSFAKSRLMCIAKATPVVEPAPVAQPEQAAPVAQPVAEQTVQAVELAPAVEQTAQAAELAPAVEQTAQAAEPALELTFENMQSAELGTEAEQLAAKKAGYSKTPHFYEKTGENFIANGDAETGANYLTLARCMRSRIAEAAEQPAPVSQAEECSDALAVLASAEYEERRVAEIKDCAQRRASTRAAQPAVEPAPVAQPVAEQTVQAAEPAPAAQPEQKTASKQKITFKSNGSAQEYSIEANGQSIGQILKFKGFYLVEFDHYERAENVQNKTATLNEAKVLVRDFFAAIEAIATAARAVFEKIVGIDYLVQERRLRNHIIDRAAIAAHEAAREAKYAKYDALHIANHNARKQEIEAAREAQQAAEQVAAAEPALELTFENMQSTELGTEAEQLAAKKLGYSRTPHFYEKTGENFIANGDAETGANYLTLARCMRSRMAEAAEQEAAREAQQVAEHYAQEASLAEVFAKAADEFRAAACGTYYAAEGTYTVSPAVQGVARLCIYIDGELVGTALPNIRVQQPHATKKRIPILEGFYTYNTDDELLGLCKDIHTACHTAYMESPAEPSTSAQPPQHGAQAAPLFWEFAARVLLHIAENNAQHPLAEIAEHILEGSTERDARPQNKLYKKIIAYTYEHLDEQTDAPLYYLLETLRRCMSRYYTPAASLALLHSQAQRIVGERTAQTIQQQCLRRLRTAQAQ
jgi:hypothetical protein